MIVRNVSKEAQWLLWAFDCATITHNEDLFLVDFRRISFIIDGNLKGPESCYYGYCVVHYKLPLFREEKQTSKPERWPSILHTRQVGKKKQKKLLMWFM